MAQGYSTAPVAAQQVLWTFRGPGDEEGEQEFYTSLEDHVMAEIKRRLPPGSRSWVGREIRLNVGAYAVHARLTNMLPVLASVTDSNTRYIAKYRQRAKDGGQDVSNFLAEIIRYPDERLGAAFDALIGLDKIKEDVEVKLSLLLNPGVLEGWVERIYAASPPQRLLQTLRDRYPLLILEGEVGSGKTALARSVGHRLALGLQKDVALFIVNAQVRGGGHVGELTQNISRAFAEAERCQEREQIPVMLLIDEADALAQARGGRQTHHEDDAGVNTLIQRIDRLRGRPMAVLFATNLAQSLDAAIMRRAIASYHFDRPGEEQRLHLFRRLLAGISISNEEIEHLVIQTEPRELPGFGNGSHRYTYSDISQRIIPQAVERAVRDGRPLNLEYLVNACAVVLPTPDMRMHQGG